MSGMNDLPLSAQTSAFVDPGEGRPPYQKVIDYRQVVDVGEDVPEEAVKLPHTGTDFWWIALNPLTAWEREHEVNAEEYQAAIAAAQDDRRRRIDAARDDLTAAGLADDTVALLLEGK